MKNEALFKEKPVWSAIFTLAIPSVLSILVMLLYNIADMFFVGMLHDNTQVAAVSVVGPVFSLVTAAATMVGVGGCAAVAKAAGAGETDHAQTCASLCGWFCLLFGTVAGLLLNVFATSLLGFLGTTPEMLEHSAAYLRVLAIGAPFMLFGTGFATLLRAEGVVKVGFLGNLAGTALNLILDPLLILVFGMGVVGAAAAMGEELVVWLLLAGPLLGLYYLSTNFLQASGNAAAASLVSVLRQGILLIPAL